MSVRGNIFFFPAARALRRLKISAQRVPSTLPTRPAKRKNAFKRPFSDIAASPFFGAVVSPSQERRFFPSGRRFRSPAGTRRSNERLSEDASRCAAHARSTFSSPGKPTEQPQGVTFSLFPSSRRDRALRHLGKAEHDRNLPCRPSRITMGLPHLSHFSSVGSAAFLALPAALV